MTTYTPAVCVYLATSKANFEIIRNQLLATLEKAAHNGDEDNIKISQIQLDLVLRGLMAMNSHLERAKRERNETAQLN